MSDSGGKLPIALRALLKVARLAARRAYAPYSGFLVGAAVRTELGAVFSGGNVENASYGLTLCAERSAIAAAVGAEGARMRVRAVAVFVSSSQAFPPCGACRQVIAEFAGPEAAIVFLDQRGTPTVTSISALLPHAFRL